MSELRLKDGTGDGNTAKVDDSNRLHTRAVSVTNSEQRAIDGFGFNLNTGLITLTDGGEHAVAYFKYTGTKTFYIEAIAVGIGATTSPVNPVEVTIVRNPTTGSIITTADPGDLNINRNFGAANTLDGDWYKGQHGDSFTNGEDGFLAHVNNSSRLFATTNFILTPQTSIGITVKLNASAGGILYVALVCYEEDE